MSHMAVPKRFMVINSEWVPYIGFQANGKYPLKTSCPTYKTMGFMPAQWNGVPLHSDFTSTKKYLKEKKLY